MKAEFFFGALIFGLAVFAGLYENFGGAVDSDELHWHEMMKESFPASAIMKESTLANGGLDFFCRQRQSREHAFAR